MLENDELLTVREVADALRVSSMTIYRLIKAGDLSAIRVGRGFRIRKSDVDTYLATQTYRPEEERASVHHIGSQGRGLSAG